MPNRKCRRVIAEILAAAVHLEASKRVRRSSIPHRFTQFQLVAVPEALTSMQHKWILLNL